jgi:hypothetical protein
MWFTVNNENIADCLAGLLLDQLIGINKLEPKIGR